jgi:hypothetical protein
VRVVAVGTVHLLAFGFESQGRLPCGVMSRLQRFQERGAFRLLDVLYVSRDERGVLGREHDGEDLGFSSASSGTTLWQLLEGNDSDTPPPASVELRPSGEVGLDLVSAEGLAYQIEPGTSALLILVEAQWATELLDAALTAGGFPIAFGCLQPETMLVIGPQLARAAEAVVAAETGAAAHGIARLDALSSGPASSSTVAAEVLRALVAARFIDPAHVDDTVNALADAGLVPSPSVRRPHAGITAERTNQQASTEMRRDAHNRKPKEPNLRKGSAMADEPTGMGPISYLIVEFPGNKMTGEGLPILVDLVERGVIRILDLMFASRDMDGSMRALELRDIDHDGQLDLAVFEGASSGLLDDSDLADAASVIEPGSAAGILIFENRWATSFTQALRRGGAELVAAGYIPQDAIAASLEATER